ncbi:hypothetical protein LZZ85_18360 [Terrimonas sp. NA20]|uniref:Uncharacterized protein n=1 Tax=Terrimonas ginsenosidimutans TaxID=2908004 RepID=A0ABS9KVD2_9BACT|nr:hypothetical protein [Terrimonas ginsenosidimutans]MCG2616268.1 hypothetical protein [Terrimonas ginsenosidimutans]
MKRSGAIVFFLIYLAAVIQIEQLVKIPVLFQHYREHIRMEGKISFLAFLQEHYVQDDGPDADYARDMQLPFKTSHHFFILMTAAAPKPAADYVSPAVDPRSHYISPFDDPGPANLFTDQIFQPPRRSSLI